MIGRGDDSQSGCHGDKYPGPTQRPREHVAKELSLYLIEASVLAIALNPQKQEAAQPYRPDCYKRTDNKTATVHVWVKRIRNDYCCYIGDRASEIEVVLCLEDERRYKDNPVEYESNGSADQEQREPVCFDATLTACQGDSAAHCQNYEYANYGFNHGRSS